MIERIFINPDSPFCEKSADWLIETQESSFEDFPSDFGGVLVVSHTRLASENIKEALACKLSKRGQKAFSGIYIETQEAIFSRLASGEKSLEKTESHAIWLKLMNAQRSRSAIFPNGVPSRDELFEASEKCLSLQNALNENLLNFSDALALLTEAREKENEKISEFEISRWTELSLMEEEFFKLAKPCACNVLKKAILSLEKGDSDALERGGVALKKIVLIGNFDASGAFISFLKAAEKYVDKISVLIFAPHSENNFFDEYGRPLPSYGEKCLELPDENIGVFFNSASQAKGAAELFEAYGEGAEKVIALACSQEFKNVEIMRSAFAKISRKAYLPESDSLKKTSFFDFIFKLRAYLEKKSFSSFRELIFSPFVFFYLENSFEASQKKLLLALDFIQREFAPLGGDTLSNALSNEFYCAREEIRLLKKVLDFFDENFKGVFFEKNSKTHSFEKNLDGAVEPFINAFFSKCGNEKPFEKEAILFFKNSLKTLEVVRKSLSVSFLPEEIFSVILNDIESAKKNGESPKGDVPLFNWVEIFWSQNPHLLICDFNDGVVPTDFAKNEFLNENVRSALGLRTRVSRRARDAYMLEALVRSRSHDGRACSIFLPLNKYDGDPLNPSRILFQVEDSKLALRVKNLFSEPKDEDGRPSYSSSWNLRAPSAATPRSLSPSALNKYLESPWEYYLQYILGAKIFDEKKSELDASQVGTLFHEAFASFSSGIAAHSENSNEIRENLIKDFEKICIQKFGEFPRVQIRLQLESLKQRLSASADVQAKMSISGWKIVPKLCESRFEMELCGHKISGVFDRVDEKSDELFILDYKTIDSSSYVGVRENHLSASGVWKNLQLPIYYAAASLMFPNKKIRCGYFLAPKDVSSTKIDEWFDIADFKDDALEKVVEIAEKIRAGDFGSAGDSKYGNFDVVFGMSKQNLKNSVEFEK